MQVFMILVLSNFILMPIRYLHALHDCMVLLVHGFVKLLETDLPEQVVDGGTLTHYLN